MTGSEKQVQSPGSRVDREDVTDGVRLIAFNRPAVRNAFDTALYLEFTQALLDADRDESVGAVVITGRGAGFSSGQDLVEMAAMAAGTAVEGSGQGFTGLLDALTEISVPMLAAVNGVAVGLGFTMLAHCDLVLVDAAARLRVPFAELGVPAEAGSSVLFPSAWHCASALRAPWWTRRWRWPPESRPTRERPRVPSPHSCGRGNATWSGPPTSANRPPLPGC